MPDILRLSSANTKVPAKVSDIFLFGALTKNRIVFWRDIVADATDCENAAFRFTEQVC